MSSPGCIIFARAGLDWIYGGQPAEQLNITVSAETSTVSFEDLGFGLQ
eukprot:gene28675-11208_t